MAPAAPTIQPALYTINDTMRLIGCCRRTVYELVSRGQLDAVKLLGGTRITAESLHALIASAPKAKIHLPTQAERKARAQASV
jgi:excisionase family DNA binding protein